ncbi:MAG: Rieske 2Fe-2S domain-containing protein, partial [Candidatus Binatia bacterium]
VEDRCAHRRVPLSHRYERGADAAIECYTKDTVTCWYHGFTYSFLTGKLVHNLSWPTCPDIGKIGIRTYPVEEAKGLVFVFIGDGRPGPLANDLLPGFLDDDHVVEGRVRVVEANWRWGVENGFDSTHIYMHRKSILFDNVNGVVPLGLVPKDLSGASTNLVLGPGPTGMRESMLEAYEPVWVTEIGDPSAGGARIEVNMTRSGEVIPIAPVLSAWLPCLVAVEGFPLPGETVYEFYVPIDERSHHYFQLMGKRCGTEEEERAFRAEVKDRWEYWMQDGFNRDDVIAREGMEDAYTDGNGWLEEHLTAQDLCIIGWRNVASRLNRGIQRRPGSADGGAGERP